MFMPILPNPTKIDLPTFQAATNFDIELIHALDTANVKTAVLAVRLHNVAGVQNDVSVAVAAYPIWPLDSEIARFQDTAGRYGATADITNASMEEFVRSETAFEPHSPYIRVVLNVMASAAVVAPGSITLSVGLVALPT